MKQPLRERLRKAFCSGCPLRAEGVPLECDGYEAGMSTDEQCFVLQADPKWLARGARRFVKMERKEQGDDITDRS